MGTLMLVVTMIIPSEHGKVSCTASRRCLATVCSELILLFKRHIRITFWRTGLMFRNKALECTGLCVLLLSLHIRSDLCHYQTEMMLCLQEWDAPETKLGMDLAVTALEGGGSYHLQAEIMGTAERLAKEAIVGRESLLQIEQHWFDVAEFRYEGMHMRADGTSFLLKFSAGAGLTYQVLAVLTAGSVAAHLRLAIFPPEAIGSASSTGVASESNCQLPPAAQDLQSKDVTEMTFGTWGSPVHGQTWGEQHRCDDLTRVGPPESDPPGCGGQYRYFPGQSFPTNHTWDWTAPFTANYVLQVTANCDVPYYDDPTQPSCTVSADGIECDDDRVTQCAAAIGLTIRVVDRSVHVKHTFDVPVTQEVLNSIELQQRMADMFALQQQPAIVFPLSITSLDCGLAENAERPSCQQVMDPGPGGGHRRRRLQTQIGADTDHACP
eukprot:SAG11_NODE_156_length_14147_cov_10.367597_4_plen_438_part_00